MRKRQQRHDIIRDIIREHNVKTQRDLANQLQAAGYECTQATISRDIMDMGLVKSREGYYVLPEAEQPASLLRSTKPACAEHSARWPATTRS